MMIWVTKEKNGLMILVVFWKEFWLYIHGHWDDVHELMKMVFLRLDASRLAF